MATPHVATIGYEAATVQSFVEALHGAGIELLVDVRAVASSRRPGFAKTRLAANLEAAGIGYLHLRGLGTPTAGRVAARAGNHAEMQRIFQEHLRGATAQDELEVLARMVREGRRIALMCLEDDPAHCHRSLVATALVNIVPVEVLHLRPGAADTE